jgi:hypothetical protein
MNPKLLEVRLEEPSTDYRTQYLCFVFGFGALLLAPPFALVG